MGERFSCQELFSLGMVLPSRVNVDKLLIISKPQFPLCAAKIIKRIFKLVLKTLCKIICYIAKQLETEFGMQDVYYGSIPVKGKRGSRIR